MLGFVTTPGRGASDRLLYGLADRLRADGLTLAGAVQDNVERASDIRCDMELHVLSGADVIRISQNLGAGSRGCRLDPAGLEQAVGLVGAALEADPDLLIINKFGKQELEGRGFRPVIAGALLRGIPVLTAVNDKNLPAFLAFADGLAERVAPTPDAARDWCLRAAGRRAA